MRVLLSGGAGFIGSHVAEALLGRHHEVAIVDDLSSGKRENMPQGIHLYEADIRSGCAEIFEGFGPEALCHQAAQIDVRRSVREPNFDADVNVLGTIRLLQACVEHGVGKVIFASSGGAVYGEQQRFPATEDHQQYPVSPYGSPSGRGSATSTTTTLNTVYLTSRFATPTSTDPGRIHTARRG
jgi:UDP-glucose 4-epimerase